MRLTASFWVAALVRRVFSRGGFAAVERHGADDAGAIFLHLRDRMGVHTLFGPAPQAGYGEGKPQDRLFQLVGTFEDIDQLEARLEREIRFDSDLWVVELEPGTESLEEFVALMTP